MKYNFLCLFGASLLLITPGGMAQDAPAAPPKAEEAKKAPKPVSDFIRYQKGEAKNFLQTAAKSYTNNDGVEVTLVGVVHIADKSYYQELNKLLGGYEGVLYELVGNPEDLKKKDESSNPLRDVQKMVGKMLELDFQLEQIDYSKPNFIHADLNLEEFQKSQAAKGESLMSLLARAMKMEREGTIPGTEELEEMDLGTLMGALSGDDGADGLKNIMARVFDQAETMIAGFEGEGGTVLLTERNKAVLKVCKREMASGKKKLAVFYGAGHLPGLEALLKEEGFKLTKEDWLNAWTMKTMKPPAKTEKPKASP